MGIKCFMLEPTNKGRIELIRSNNAWLEGGGIDPAKACPLNGYSHLARAWAGETPVEQHEVGYFEPVDRDALLVPHNDPRWPQQCGCGYRFTPDDNYSSSASTIYCNPETGEEYLLRDAPVGAMWYADWMCHGIPPERSGPGTFRGPDGHCLNMQLPGDWDWCIDGPATNGDGWTRTGTPPNVTASPSVWANAPKGWHGWLRNGELVEA
jgi:hypothetical protein